MAKNVQMAPEFEGMALTEWQKICNVLLGRALKKKARKDTELMALLAQADIRVMPEVYKATNILSTVLVCLGSLALLGLIFAPSAGLLHMYESQTDPATAKACIDWAFWHPTEAADARAAGVPGDGCPHYSTKDLSATYEYMIIGSLLFVVPPMSYRHFSNTAERKKKARSEKLEMFIPYAASYTAAMAAANATPAKIFKSLAANEDIYGEIAYDSAMIYRDITLLGMDLVTAIKLAVDRSASPWGTEFFQGMVGTLSSGGNLKLYFLNRAEHYMRENRIRLNMFLETLGLMAESYIVVAVAMPLFLIVMLVIMFWVSGKGSQLSEGMVYGIVMGMLPAIHIAYSGLIWMMSKEMEM